jgi:hypothetical protein
VRLNWQLHAFNSNSSAPRTLRPPLTACVTTCQPVAALWCRAKHALHCYGQWQVPPGGTSNSSFPWPCNTATSSNTVTVTGESVTVILPPPASSAGCRWRY